MFSAPYTEANADEVPLPDAKLKGFVNFLGVIYPLREKITGNER